MRRNKVLDSTISLVQRKFGSRAMSYSTRDGKFLIINLDKKAERTEMVNFLWYFCRGLDREPIGEETIGLSEYRRFKIPVDMVSTFARLLQAEPSHRSLYTIRALFSWIINERYSYEVVMGAGGYLLYINDDGELANVLQILQTIGIPAHYQRARIASKRGDVPVIFIHRPANNSVRDLLERNIDLILREQREQQLHHQGLRRERDLRLRLVQKNEEAYRRNLADPLRENRPNQLMGLADYRREQMRMDLRKQADAIFQREQNELQRQLLIGQQTVAYPDPTQPVAQVNSQFDNPFPGAVRRQDNQGAVGEGYPESPPLDHVLPELNLQVDTVVSSSEAARRAAGSDSSNGGNLQQPPASQQPALYSTVLNLPPSKLSSLEIGREPSTDVEPVEIKSATDRELNMLKDQIFQRSDDYVVATKTDGTLRLTLNTSAAQARFQRVRISLFIEKQIRRLEQAEQCCWSSGVYSKKLALQRLHEHLNSVGGADISKIVPELALICHQSRYGKFDVLSIAKPLYALVWHRHWGAMAKSWLDFQSLAENLPEGNIRNAFKREVEKYKKGFHKKQPALCLDGSEVKDYQEYCERFIK